MNIQVLSKHKYLFFILVFSVLVRIPLLHHSFWLDEAAQAMESARPFWQQHNIAWDFQPPLFHYLTHFLLQLNQSEWWLRLTSLLCAVGSIGFLYRCVEKTTSERAAIIAAILVSTSSFHIFYSHELRPYMLATFFATASWYFLITFVTTGKKNSLGWYTAATILGLYSMYLYPFLVLSQLVFVFFQYKKNFILFCFSLVVSGICFLPWLPSFVEQLRVGTGWTSQLPGWADVVGTPQLKALPLTIAKFFSGPVELRAIGQAKIGFIIPILIGMIASVSTFLTRKQRLYALWFIAPILSSWVISFFIPVIQPKRVLFALPALFACCAIWFDGMYDKQKRRTIFALTVILLTNGATLFAYWTNPLYQREDWKKNIRIIETECEQTSCTAVFAFNEPFAPWQWYAHKNISTAHLQTLTATSYTDVNNALTSALQNTSRVYTFDYLTDITDPNHIVIDVLLSHGFTQQRVIDGGKMGFIRVFELGLVEK